MLDLNSQLSKLKMDLKNKDQIVSNKNLEQTSDKKLITDKEQEIKNLMNKEKEILQICKQFE